MNPATIKLKMNGLAVRIGDKVFAYDRETGTLGIRFELAQLKQPHGWIFVGVSPREWERFCKDPRAAARLSYWMERGHLLSSPAELTFQSIWDGNKTEEVPQDLFSVMIQSPAKTLMSLIGVRRAA